jgi:hypothetical protein
MRMLLQSLSINDPTRLSQALQFVVDQNARGLPGAEWIHGVSVHHQENSSPAQPEWCENLICLVVCTVNLQHLTLDSWRASVLLVTGQLRASTMRVLRIKFRDELFTSALYINRLVNLDHLSIDAWGSRSMTTLDLSKLPALCLPRLRRLTVSGYDTSDLHEFLSLSQLDELQSIYLHNNKEEVDGNMATHLRALIGRKGLRYAQFRLAAAHYSTVVPYVQAECIYLRGRSLTPAFIGHLCPSVQSLILEEDTKWNPDGLWSVLDHLLSTTTCIRSVRVDTFLRKMNGSYWLPGSFHWAPRDLQRDDHTEAHSFRGRMVTYARAMADKGIRLCDINGITLQEHLRVVGPACYPNDFVSQTHMAPVKVQLSMTVLVQGEVQDDVCFHIVCQYFVTIC